MLSKYVDYYNRTQVHSLRHTPAEREDVAETIRPHPHLPLSAVLFLVHGEITASDRIRTVDEKDLDELFRCRLDSHSLEWGL